LYKPSAELARDAAARSVVGVVVLEAFRSRPVTVDGVGHIPVTLGKTLPRTGLAQGRILE
jgi:hypothetical protein